MKIVDPCHYVASLSFWGDVVVISSPPLSALLKANGKTTIRYGFLLVAIVVIIAILASSGIFTVLPSPSLLLLLLFTYV